MSKKKCEHCGREYADVTNDWKNEARLEKDSVETYNHMKLNIEYCSCCGHVEEMVVSSWRKNNV